MKKVLSLDAGGIKGLYTLIIIDGITKKYKIDFNKNFNHYTGTSIGAVMTSSLAYGVDISDILKKIIGFRNDLHKGHVYLIRNIFEWIDYVFGKELFGNFKSHVFIPLYNFSNKELAFFSSNLGAHGEILIADVLKAACSDIRIVQPHPIKSINYKYADAGFFAYDPILYFLRSEQVIMNRELKILSIGSGLIENVSNDLSAGEIFDIIYDSFLYDQFETTKFALNTFSKEYNFDYFRISEFPHLNNHEYTIEYIYNLAQKKMMELKADDFKSFIG